MLPELRNLSTKTNDQSPDYTQLVCFLLSPLLDAPEALSIDCEESNSNQRVWIRVAFDNAEKGRVIGRGGRNLQAISTVLNAAGKAVGQSVYLEIYGGYNSGDSAANDSGEERGGTKRSSLPRPSPKPSPKLRSE